MRSRVDLAESQVEELKQRLDDALGAEEMVEQLSEHNMALSEVGRHPFPHMPMGWGCWVGMLRIVGGSRKWKRCVWPWKTWRHSGS